MAFKFIVLCSLLAYAQAGAIFAPTASVAIANPAVDAVASTHQNVVRSFGGTVSTYSKAIDTPYSSVRKTDTRISNNVYTPAVAKTLTYAAPVTKTVYSAPVVAKTVYSAPVVAKPLAYAAPTVYSHAAPTVYSHAAPTVYSHAAPAVVAAPHAITYSPAASVAHISFDGFGTHWGY